MKTRFVALASAAALGILAGASCTTENRASVQAQAVCAPTKTCIFAATCDAQYIGYPVLDKLASASDSLWLFVQVANQLPNNADVALGRLNTNDAHIDETSIEYEGAMAGTAAVGSNFYVPAEGTAVVSVNLPLTNAVGGAGAATNEVVAHIRFRGYLDDGTRFEAGDFPVTVLVCADGCAPAVCGATTPCPDEGQRPVACGT